MGAVALDPSVLIGFFDRGDPHHDDAVAELVKRIEARDELLLVASSYVEIAVQPARDGRLGVIDGGLAAAGIEVVPVERSLARMAAELRARHGSLRLPDALVVALALERSAGLVTFDDRMARVHANEEKGS